MGDAQRPAGDRDGLALGGIEVGQELVWVARQAPGHRSRAGHGGHRAAERRYPPSAWNSAAGGSASARPTGRCADARGDPGGAGGRPLVGPVRPRAGPGELTGQRDEDDRGLRDRTRGCSGRLHPGGPRRRAGVPPRGHRPIPANRRPGPGARAGRDPDPGRVPHRRARPPPADDRSGGRQRATAIRPTRRSASAPSASCARTSGSPDGRWIDGC